MLKKLIRYYKNFKTYISKGYYQSNHPDGKSYPKFFKRLKIFWALRNEPTFDERIKVWKGYN